MSRINITWQASFSMSSEWEGKIGDSAVFHSCTQIVESFLNAMESDTKDMHGIRTYLLPMTVFMAMIATKCPANTPRFSW